MRNTALLALLLCMPIAITAGGGIYGYPMQAFGPMASGEPFIKRWTIGINTNFALADHEYVELADGNAEKQDVSFGFDNTLWGINTGLHTSYMKDRLWVGAIAGFDTRIGSKEILVKPPGVANTWRIAYTNSLAWLALEAKTTVNINLSKLGFFGGVKGVYKMGKYTGDNADYFRALTDTISEYQDDFDFKEEFLIAPYGGISFQAEKIEFRLAYEYLDYKDAILEIPPHRIFFGINYMIDFYKVVEF